MKSNRIKSGFLKITGYYAGLIIIVLLISWIFPSFVDYLPVGTAQRIFSNIGTMELDSTAYAERLSDEGVAGHTVFFALCFVTSLLLAIPVGTVYLATRQERKKSDSLAKLVIILPIAVTGLVLIVQNSLALAFGLAGIVAGGGIRFRTNMREFTDTLFFLISIGIGLSAGIGALGLALIMSAIFNYAVLVVFALEYGEFAAPVGMEDSDPVKEEKETAGE